MHAQTNQVQTELQSTSSRLAASEAQLSDLAKLLGSSAPASVGKDLSALQSQLKDAQQKLKDTSAQLQSTQTELDGVQGQLQSTQEELSQGQASFADVSERLDAVQQKERDLRESLNSVEARVKSLEGDLATEKNARQTAEKDAESAHAEAAQLNQVSCRCPSCWPVSPTPSLPPPPLSTCPPTRPCCPRAHPPAPVAHVPTHPPACCRRHRHGPSSILWTP